MNTNIHPKAASRHSNDLQLTIPNQAVKKALPLMLGGALALALVMPANAVTTTESGAVNATIDLVRQFSQRVSLAQSSGYLDEQISEINSKPRAARMAPISLNFAPSDVRAVPVITGLPRRDGAGRLLGYCAWDNTSATNVMDSGTLAYLAGNVPGNTDQLVYAVISPGRDGRIETSCADVLLLQQTIQSERGGGLGDDLVYARRPLQQSSRTFRSTVGTQSGLPSTQNTEGDVRLVMDTNTLYAFNGGAWSPIGGNPAERFTGDGSGNLSYTGGKVTVADFEATTATISTSLIVNGATTLNGTTLINGALSATTLTGSAAGLTDLNASNMATGTLAVARGGTGIGSAPGLNQILIGDGTGYILSTLTAGAGIGVSNAGGLLTLSNTGLLNISSPMSTVNLSTTNGVVTLDLPQNIAATATPTFGGLMLNGALTGTTGTFSGAVSASRIDVSTSAGGVTMPNMIVGTGAMPGIQSGYGSNTAIGINTLVANTNGSSGTAVGGNALYSNISGDLNTAIGAHALYSNLSGNFSTAVGAYALYKSDGGFNTAVGNEAMYENVNGYFNVAFGTYALQSNVSGDYNTALGEETLISNTTGSSNTAVGAFSFDNNTTGNFNTGLGYSAEVTVGNLSYATAIGAQATVATSNTLVLGRNSTVDQVVIGTNTRNDTTASTKLYVNGISRFNGMLYGTASTYSGTVTANLFSGSGASLTSLNAGNISSGTLAVTRGGTGLDGSAAANGALLIGNGTGYTLGTLTAGAGVSVTNGAGSITIASTGVTGFNSRTGAVSLTLADVNGVTNFGTNNLTLGTNALSTASTGTDNTGLGFGGLRFNTSGSNNTAVGKNSLYSNTTGSSNVATGRNSLYANTTGVDNAAFGSSSLFLNTTGSYNTANGRQSLYSNTTGQFNTATGYNALYSTTTGVQNTSIGGNSAFANTTGNFNVFVGQNAGDSNTTGGSNTFIGTFSDATTGALSNATAIGASSTVATSNTMALGRNSTADQIVMGTDTRNDTFANTKLYVNGVSNFNGALYGTTATFSGAVTVGSLAAARLNVGTSVGVGTSNLIVGNGALAGVQSGNGGNTALGTNALASNSTGYYNIAVGEMALVGNTTGDTNISIGYQSMYDNSTGHQNVGMGYLALSSNTTGIANNAIGYVALGSNTTGYDNVALGVLAGIGNATGYSNTFLGARTNAASAALTYASAIGAESIVSTSNTLALGRASDVTVMGATGDNGSGDRLQVTGNIALTTSGVGASVGSVIRFGTAFEESDDIYLGRINASNNNSILQMTLGDDPGFTYGSNGDRFQIATTDGSVRHYFDSNGSAFHAGTLTVGSLSAPRLDILTSDGVSLPNLIVGAGAMAGAQSGFGSNTAVGISSLAANTTGEQNVAIGRRTLISNSSGSSNVAVGKDALFSNSTGSNNSALGYFSMGYNTSGFGNTAMGFNALTLNTTASFNAAFGSQALQNSTGGSNTGLGQVAGFDTTTGSGNTFVGAGAGRINTTGSSNSAFGVNAQPTSGALTYATVMGADARVATSNTVVLGRSNGSDQVVVASTSRNDDYANVKLYVNGGIFGNTAIVNSSNSSAAQGAHLQWNRGGGDGVTYLINQRGLGGGGLSFGESSGSNVYSQNMFLTAGGNLSVVGSMTATAFNVSSDRRLKTNITQQDTSSILGKLEQLNSYSYDYILNRDLGRRIGVIAQELLPLFPEAVAVRADGFMAVDYNALGAMAAVGVGQLNSKFNTFEKFTKEKFDSVDKEITFLKTETAKIKGLEDWRDVANSRMDTMQSSIDKNLAKMTENTLAIEKNTAQIKRLDDVLITLDTTVKGQGEAIDGINTRWVKTFTASEDGAMLTVTAAELKANNFTAQQVRSNSVYTARLEAEMAKIKELDIDKLRANSAVTNTLQAEQMNTGATQVYAGVGSPAFLFSAATDGHYTVNTSALDGSYATATVIVNAGQAKIVPIANDGIQLLAVGNSVKALAAGKSIKATWIKMG